MAATNYTPIQLYYSTTASAAPTAGNLASGELAINITDGKLYYKDNGGVVQVIATKGAGTIGGSTTQIQYNNAGALAGSAAMTFNSGTNTTTLTTLNLTNALGATYGGTAQSTYTQGDVLYASAANTLSKLGIGTANYILTSTGSVPQWVAPTSVTVQTANNLAGGAAGSVPYQSAADTTTFLAIGTANRVLTSSGTAPQWVTALTGLTGVSSSSITNTSLTSGRVVYSGASGVETDSASLTFNGTTLSAGGFSTTGLSTLVKTVTIGDSNFSGTAVFAAATPAKLYIGTGTVTDTTSAIGATNATGAISSLAITPIAATNTSVTYTNASTLYIAGAPSAGTNVTITNPYSMYVAAGMTYFGGYVGVNGGINVSGAATLSAAQGSMVLTFDNPVNRIIMGDGSGYSFALSKRASSTTTDLLTLNDNGTLGLGGAPISTVRQYIKGAGATSATWSLYIDDSAASNIFYVRNDGAAYHSGNTGIGTSNNYGAKFAVLGGALNTSSAGLAISSQLSAGRLTSGDTNVSTAYIGQFLDQSITEVSAGSSGIYTSGIVAFAGTAAVNPNTVGFYTAGTRRALFDANGNFGVGTGSTVNYKLQVNSGSSGATSAFSSINATVYSATSYNGATARILLTGGSASGAANGIEFTQGGSAEIFFGQVQEASGASAFVFQGYNGSSYVERLRIDAASNLLLGTQTARNRLTVQGTVYSTPTLGVASGQAFFGEAAGYGTMIGTSGFGYGWIQQQRVDGTATAYDLYLQPAGGLVTIGGTGNDGRRLTILGSSNDTAGVGITYSGVAASSISVNSSGSLLFNLNNSDGKTERARIESSGLFNAITGSYSDVSINNTNSFQISIKATYSDNSPHQFSNIESCAGMIHIRATGLASIPFYPNAGGGIAYGWTVLNPQLGTWAVGQGPTVNFTEFSSSPNSYSVVFNGGGGSFTITRTGGTTPYTVAVQRFATV